MANSLKTMWSALAVSLAAVTSVNAAFFDDNCCPPADCPCPSSRPFLDPCGNWFFDVEGLCWEACEDGLSFATKHKRKDRNEGSPQSPGDCKNQTNSKVKNLGSSWDGGFKIGVGTDLPCDCWDTLVKWTWFRTKTKKHENARDESWLTGAWDTQGCDGFALEHIKAKWSLHLNIVDWELGREFCVSPCLSLRPFIGIRGAWVDQKYDIKQKFRTFDFARCDANRDSDLRMKSKFSGAGVRGGLNSEWKWGCGFSIYGEAAGSILWGTCRRHTVVKHKFSDEIELVRIEDEFVRKTCNDQKDHQHWGCRAITDAAIGLRWKQFFDCDRIALTFSVGWEHHCFLDQNRFEELATCFNPQPQKQRGDLYTQGVTFAARLDF